MTLKPELRNCDLCGDQPEKLELRAKCHLTAPLRATIEGNKLTLNCYLPECDRVVAVLELAERREDDEEPTDADFFGLSSDHRQCTFGPHEFAGLRQCRVGSDSNYVVVYRGAGDARGSWRACINGCAYSQSVAIPTRGHFRRLCAALGIPAKQEAGG